jgi:hypothetical protein
MLPPRSYLSGHSFRPAYETFILKSLRGGGGLKINETVGVPDHHSSSKFTECLLNENSNPLSSDSRPNEKPFPDLFPDPRSQMDHLQRMNRTCLITILRKHGNFNCQRLKKSDLIQQVIHIQTSSLSLSRLQNTYGTPGLQPCVDIQTNEIRSLETQACSDIVATPKDGGVGDAMDNGEQPLLPHRSEVILMQAGIGVLEALQALQHNCRHVLPCS